MLLNLYMLNNGLIRNFLAQRVRLDQKNVYEELVNMIKYKYVKKMTKALSY
jgi:hypothetical protein